MATAPKPVAPIEPEVDYPASDGQPMGETEFHVDALLLLYATLKEHFRRRPVYVAADMFLYYEAGNPRPVKAPDLMAFHSVSKHRRRIFKTWEEKAVPCVIVELASDNSVAEDLGEKKGLYAQLGVREYFVFDPEHICLDPPLLGFRRRGRKFVPLPLEPDGCLACQELGLRLRAEEYVLRLVDGRTGKPLLSPLERALEDRQRLKQARQRTEQAEQRAEQAEQRADTLAAELERLRAESGKGERPPR
jgi:Uma2 family endonuclease